MNEFYREGSQLKIVDLAKKKIVSPQTSEYRPSN